LNEQTTPPGQLPPQTPDPEPHAASVEVVVVVAAVEVVVVVGAEAPQLPGAAAFVRRKVFASLPSCTATPPNSVQYDSSLSVVTRATGDMVPSRSMATWLPLHTALASTPALTITSLHVAPVLSLYL
jgi:hypothetical protein